MDHFPIPVRHGGTETVPACHLCHTLKDRKSAGWLEPTAIYDGTKHLSRRSDGMPLVVHLLDLDAERWVAGEVSNWPTHDDLERIGAWVKSSVERCTTTDARLYLARAFGDYLDAVDGTLKRMTVHEGERDQQPLPQSQWPAFRVPTCIHCGHASGDHVSAGAVIARAPVRGACKRCDCRQYEEER